MLLRGCQRAESLQESPHFTMETIPLEQLEKLFLDLRSETDWDIDGPMLWGYYFLSPDADKLMAAGGELAENGYTIVGIFEEEAEDEEGNEVLTSLNVLHVERVEGHTPESLFARNGELEALATKYDLEAYDGMDVNPVSEPDEFDTVDADAEDGALENPDLLEAIDALRNASEEQEEAALDALSAELQKAVFLVPVLGEPEAEEGSASIQVMICVDDEGEEFVPLFTDVARLRTWSDAPVSAVAVYAEEAWNLVLSQEQCHGAVVNPSEDDDLGPLIIPRDDVEALRAEAAEASEAEEEE